MARRLQALVATLSLDPKVYRLRAGEAVGTCPRSADAAVFWEASTAWNKVGDDDNGATFEGTLADRWTARARLASATAGVYVTDTVYDTGANGARTVRTPTLEAAGTRSWLGLELAYAEPDASTTVLIRVYDGATGDELYWTGSEWAAGTTGDDDPTKWNTPQVAQDNFSSLPGDVRQVAILAWLRSSSTSYSPSFYGARLAYGVRQVAPLDDALFRTVLASLQAELRATGVMEWTTAAAGESSVELVASGDSVGPGSFAYDVTAVDAVFDLTADPDELVELPGVYAAGTWTPTVPLPGSSVIRLEFRYTPDLVVRRHRDVEQLARLPAIYMAATGAPSQVLRAQDSIVVRDTNASPPVALELAEPEIVTVPLELRVIAELGADAQRLAQALTRWLATLPDGSAGGTGTARELISPETGQVIRVRSASRGVESTAGLARGVAEARAAWLLTFPRASAQTTTTAALVSLTGATFTTSTRGA